MVAALLLAFALSLLWVLVVAAGLRLLWTGVRGRTSDDQPRCAGCRYNLQGLDVRPERCPECGSCLLGIGKIELGVRRPAPHIAVAGLVVLTLACAPVGVMRSSRAVAPAAAQATTVIVVARPRPRPQTKVTPPVGLPSAPAPSVLPAKAESELAIVSPAALPKPISRLAALGLQEPDLSERTAVTIGPHLAPMILASVKDVADFVTAESLPPAVDTLDLVVQLYASLDQEGRPLGPQGEPVGLPFLPSLQHRPIVGPAPARPSPIDRRVVRDPRDARVPDGRIERRVR